MDKFAFTLGVKRYSERCENKNLRPFGIGWNNLLFNKLNTLIQVKDTDIYVHSEHDGILLEISKRYGNRVNLIKRDNYYASKKCSGSDFLENLALHSDADVLIYTPITVPFITKERYEYLIDLYKDIVKTGFTSVILGKRVNFHM